MKRNIVFIVLFVWCCWSAFAQSFSQTTSQAEQRIANLKQAERLVASSIQNTDAITAMAQQTPKPQQYIDFVLLRYERNNRKIQLAIVQAANEAVQAMSAFIGNASVNQLTLKQGIAKYTAISAEAHKFANELQEQFFDHFSSYLNNYGYDCQAVFEQDDMELLLEYEVY